KKWEIRKQISPQLKQLWESHPALIRAMAARVMSKSSAYMSADQHHSNPVVYTEPVLRSDQIDLCASITKSGVSFRPLVRDSFALTCSLHIIFLRREPVGSVYTVRRSGAGDLDNRIKTVLDALCVPHNDQVMDTSIPHMYCLLEDDKLVTGLNVETRRLLT